MIQRIYIDNYKCLTNFELKLDQLTLLTGPNGVGKSAVLDVLYAMRRLLSQKAVITDADVFPTSSLTRWDTRTRQTIELDFQLDEELITYRLEVEHEPETERARINLERLSTAKLTLFEFVQGQVGLYDDHGKRGAQFTADWNESFLARVVPRQENRRVNGFLDMVRRIVICGMYPGSMASDSRTEDAILARDGSNFASWYRHLMQERPDLVGGLAQALGEVIPGLKSLRLEKVAERARSLVVAFRASNGQTRDFTLAFDELSDGQRALVVLYALLELTADAEYTLVLDEPDNYIALPEIQPWLMELRSVCGERVRQALLCSHHPELIDYLGADTGLLMTRDPAGPVSVRAVADVVPSKHGSRRPLEAWFPRSSVG